ncbi:MAG: hypothetical protein ACJ714_01380 [Ornithinibacter sp.]
MTLWQTITDGVKKKSFQQVDAFIHDPSAAAFVPDASYVQLTLADMSLGTAMLWFQERYPSVTATVSLDFAGATQSFTTVAGPPGDKLGPGVFLNYPLTPLLPYRGGVVQITAGLVALKGDNRVKIMLDVLADFSSLVAPPLGAAVKVASKLDDGVGRLLDSTGVVLGLHNSYVAPGPGAANGLEGGYYAVVRAADATFDKAQLSVVDSRLLYGGQPLDGYDYILLHLGSRQERDSWAFPDLQALLDEAKRRRILEDDNGYDDVRKQLLAAIVTSPDFTDADRWIIADKVKDQLHRLASLADGAVISAEPTLEEALQASRLDLDQAASRPPITLDSLLTATP